MARLSQSLFLAAIVSTCFAPCLLATTLAADDVQKFVSALRERRYHDTAAEYLETLIADSRRSPEAKQRLLFEQGVVLVEAAATVADPVVRDRQLAQAQSKLKAYLASDTSGARSAQAQERLAGVLRTRADGMLTAADNGASSPAVRTEAGKLYDEARGLYTQAAKQLRAELDELPKDDLEKREEIGNQWLGVRFNAARSMFDLASVRDSKDEKKKLLTEAAEQCDEIYSKFSQRKAGVLARLYQGRCYQELGDTKKALAAFGDLITELSETDQDARQLKTLAMKHSLESWLRSKDYAKAVEKAVPWAKTARGAELRDPTWLEVKLGAATALSELAAKGAKNSPETKKQLEELRELAGDVAKSGQAELRNRGRMLLAQAGRSDPPAAAAAAVKLGEFKTFDEAIEKAEDLIDEVKTSRLELEYVEKDEKPDPKEIASLNEAISKYEDQAFQLLKRAIELSDQSSNQEKLQEVYYLLGFFHYQRGEYLEAAVFSEHVAKKFPESPSARPAARVAMAAFGTSFQKAAQANADSAFEAQKLGEIAEYVSKKWPGSPEADSAFSTLLQLYISQGDYDKAKETLNHIKDDSPGRAEAEASLGQGLWGRYLRGLYELQQQQAGAEGEATAEAKTKQAELDVLAKEAQSALERGVDVIRKQKDVNPRMMLAALSLAQIYVHSGQAEKALGLMEDPKLGPMTLLNKKHSAATSEGIPAEIYKTAMRAYVSVEPPQIEKATAAMDALEKIYANDPGGDAKFTQLLVGVASDLQQQLEELRRTGNEAKQVQQVAAFEQFLRRIPERKSGTDFKTLYWVAITYQKLADGLAGSAKTSKQAQNYYSQSAKTLDGILKRELAKPGFVPEANLPAIKLQKAKSQRGAGEFDSAIATFAALLKDKPTWLDAQEAAAETYQRRAANDPKFYVQAIRGGMKGDAATIWGWGALGKKTAQNPQFKENFHRARYNLALCRRKYAASREKPEEKTKHLTDAKNDIRITKQFEPTLGGETWRPKYDKLLREIQQALNEPVTGLQEFEQKAAAAPAAAK